jgi:hypothetical protein
MKSPIVRIATALAAVAAVTAAGVLPAVADDRGSLADGQAGRGEVVAVEPLRPLPSAADVRAQLAAAHFDTESVRYGVDAYQLVYRTVDAAGQPTVASGLVALPRNGVRSLQTVSYTHGTELNRTDAPSHWRDGWSVAPALTYASAGFAAVAPDYLGLGLGPGFHPFLDVPSETTASLDMLRAARAFAASRDRRLDRDVLVTGFSQGATAATGLAQLLQERGDDWFRLRALAPIAGAYDFGGVELPALLDGTVRPPYNVGYTAYLVVAWNRLHELYSRPDEVFAAPYADKVEKLYDGLRSGDDLGATLPESIEELYTARGLDLLRHPSGSFAAALAGHDAAGDGLRPGVPVRLLVSPADEQVPRANSEHYVATLRASGVDSAIVDLDNRVVDDSGHKGANVAGTAFAVHWFLDLT